MVKVKICGITNLEDALAAVTAGADVLGFNFYRRSPRFIEPLAARRIVRELPADLLTVGVFVNEPGPDTVQRLADLAEVSAVQLHGDESPDYCGGLGDRFVIKALRVDGSYIPEHALSYPVDAILLDAFDQNSPRERGGTGQTCDWTRARLTRELVPKLFLAGGLAPENVSDAIAAVEPYGVDAASKLEASPGRKDTALVRAFIAAARKTESTDLRQMTKI
ncbi:MAG TPA: phosphoribosylanthranilate isomerase [Pyrinomonadaceae bacterium]|nr:phosphoribosylanthranilate isomerase [Pyrinomonadaceae bacterium]